MSITATVEAGKIILPADVQWPAGTVVRIKPVGDQPPGLWEALKDFDGIANDLPEDLAANLDHYVHGKPRPLGRSSSMPFILSRGLIEALTADHHFEQAGFTALLK